MTRTKKMILALGLVAAAVASNAQTATTGAASVGVLGQRYGEVSFGLDEIDFVDPNLYSANLSANLPVTSALDVGATYSYGWIRGNARGHSNTLVASATAYTTLSTVKPFATAALGHQWSRIGGFSDDSAFWGLAVGVEIPFGSFAVTPRIAYADDFESGSAEQITYQVEANYWFSPTTAGFASLGYTDVVDTRVDVWSYEVGLRFRF